MPGGTRTKVDQPKLRQKVVYWNAEAGRQDTRP
jgi:hypothetical protein